MAFPSAGKLAVPALLLVVLAVFWGSLGAGFVWDDGPVVLERVGRYTQWGDVPALFTIRDKALPEDETPYYRPLAYLTFFLDSRLWGQRPMGYHMENVLLHGCAVVLLYLLAMRLSADRALAFSAALLFAVHPVTAEPVSFIAGGRNTLLCAALMLGALVFLEGEGGRRRTAPALFLYALALLSKESAVALLPFVLFRIWGAERGGEAERRHGRLMVGAAFAGVTAAYLLARYSVLGVLGSGGGVSFTAERTGLVLASVFEYIRLALFPLDLNAFYRVEPVSLISFRAFTAAAGLALLVGVSLGRRLPLPVRWGSAWAFLGLLPVINIVPIPSAPVAERYLYIPLMGFCLIAGFLVRALYNRHAALGTALLFALAVLLGVRTEARTHVWSDNMSLFKSMVSDDSGNFRGHGLLGLEYEGAGQYGPALEHLAQAERLSPEDPRTKGNLGNIYFRLGDYGRAAEYYEEALALGLGDPGVYYNMAMAADRLGDAGRAAEHYKAFVEKAEALGEPAYDELLDRARERLGRTPHPQ